MTDEAVTAALMRFLAPKFRQLIGSPAQTRRAIRSYMTIYYTLVASLPPLPDSFDAGPSPITASTLRHRLSMLGDDDRQVVDQLSDFFRWDRQPIERSDAEVIATHRHLTREIDNPLVLSLIEHRFEMRTLVAAVRCQRVGHAS